MENNKRHSLVWAILVFILLLAVAIFWYVSKDPSILDKDGKEVSTENETYNISPDNGYGVAIEVDENLGQYLVGPNGMSLYVTTRESCVGECLEAWLPYIVSSPEENPGGILGTVKRGNGYQQTYNGAPLYYYRVDTKTGDILGHALNGEWFLARP